MRASNEILGKLPFPGTAKSADVAVLVDALNGLVEAVLTVREAIQSLDEALGQGVEGNGFRVEGL